MTKRRDGQPMCIYRRCRRPRFEGLKLCAMHEADRLFSLEIRASGEGICWGREFLKVRCGGEIQCCHIITRGRHALRWSGGNAVPMCAGHHVYFTHHGPEWQEFVKSKGVNYDQLYWDSTHEPRMDPVEVIRQLESA